MLRTWGRGVPVWGTDGVLKEPGIGGMDMG